MRNGILRSSTVSLTLASFLSGLITSADALANPRFLELKNEIWEQPYEQLPQYQVKAKNFGKRGNSEDNHVLKAGKRTLKSSADLIELPTPHKLLQANGICFTGRWRINSDSPYSGLFSNMTDVASIVRASVSLSGTKQSNKRAFGLAIKLLPDDLGNSPSLNIFTLNSLGGVINKHVLNLPVDNEPDFGQVPKFSDIGTALRLKADLQRAEKQHLQDIGDVNAKANVTYRGLDHVAAYNSEQVTSPKWIRLSAAQNERIDLDDFRDELDLQHYSDNSIVYTIEVAASAKSKKKAQWLEIGELSLTDSVSSLACDTRLHFQHPG